MIQLLPAGWVSASGTPAAGDGSSWREVVIVAVAFAVVYPAQAWLRRRVSSRRRARWRDDDPGRPGGS